MTSENTFSRRFFTGALASAGLGGVMVPAIARAQAPTPPPLSVYGKLPAIEHVAISPDGTRVALVMDKGGTRVVYDYDLATGKAAGGAIEGDKIRRLMWADNQRILVYSSLTEKVAGGIYENWYATLLDLPNNKRNHLYGNVPGHFIHAITGDFYRLKTKDGYRITASSIKAPEGVNLTSDNASVTGGEDVNRCIYAFNTATLFPSKLDDDARRIENWVVRPNGTVAARSEYDETTKIWILRYKSEKGWKQIYSEKAPVDAPTLLGLGRDGISTLVLFNGGERAGQFFEFSPAGELTPIALEGDTNYPLFHPTTFVLAGFGNAGPIENWTFYDAVMGRLPALANKALPNRKNQLMDTAENPRQALIYTEGDGDSGTYYVFDFTQGSYKEIGATYPDLPGEWVAEKRYITYKAADGLDIPAFVTLPPDRDAKNSALVVLPHGGPESYDDSGFHWIAQAFASRGYVVLQPNFRGSAGYGNDYTSKGYGEWGRKMQTDLSDGVAYLVREGMVDPKRVAIAGHSYGGYAALAGVTLQDGIYNCAAAIAGISDIRTMLEWERQEHNGGAGDSPRMLYLKRFVGDAARLDEISPIRHVDTVKVPVMLIHGKDDTVVSYDQSRKFVDAMTKAGKPVEFTELKEEDHWLSREGTRVQAIEAMVAFVLKNNPPV